MSSIFIDPWIGTVDEYGTGTSSNAQTNFRDIQLNLPNGQVRKVIQGLLQLSSMGAYLLRRIKQVYFGIYREWFWKTVVYSVFMTNKVMGKYRSTGVVKDLEPILDRKSVV